MPEEQLWCLWMWESNTDYILCDWDIDVLPKLYKQDEIRYEYNQANQDRSRVSCTVFGAIWMASDLMNYQFSLAEIKEIDDWTYDNAKYPYIRKRWQWRYTKYAVDRVETWRNSNETLVKKYGKIAYYRMSRFSSMLQTALEYNYTLETNFCPTVAYNNDYKADWMLDWKDFGKQTNGHAVDIINYKWQRSVKDSYKWRKTTNWKKDCNIYWLKHELKDITNYSDRLYIYTKVNNLEEVKQLNEIKSEILVSTESNSKLWHLTNNQNYKKKLHDENERKKNNRLWYINKRLAEIS